MRNIAAFLKSSPALLAGFGSLSLLITAFGFQYLGGLAPCVLCIWQRWPHVLAGLLGLASIKIKSFWLYLAGATSAATSAGIGIFHTGVERGFWRGTQACSGGVDLSDLSAEDAYSLIMNATVAKCDEVAWQMAGLSMASWNAVASLVMVGIWIVAALKSRKGHLN